MNKLAIGTALAALSLAIPAASPAQQRIAAATIAVVDTDRISRECTACRAAATQIQTQDATLRARAQTLQQQLQTQSGPLQTAVNALNGKQPDAALQARITAFNTQERNAQQEIANGQRNLQSTQLHVNQQIGRQLLPIVQTVAVARGATLAVDKGSTLYSAPALDITNEVLAQLNQRLPSVSVTPLPQPPAQQQQPQGR